jgi:regulator of extracellular matrix RemA (YlzA/DUF370 family)
VSGTELVHVGFGSLVAVDRVLAIVTPDSAPIRRMIREARHRGFVIDVTHGRKTKAVVVLDNGYLLLASIQPDTIAHRLAQQRQEDSGV